MGKNDIKGAGDELAAMAARLRALEEENVKLKASKAGKLSLKVGAKGGLSVYGMGRFPITLYKAQWEKLLGEAETILTFIKAHESEFTTKGVAVTGDKATAPNTGAAI